MTAGTTRCTIPGLVVREDPGFGLMVYSPFTGLIYAVHPRDSQQVLEWLDEPHREAPSPEYAAYLGGGWAVPLASAKFPTPHLLPSAEMWSNLPKAESPILVNWLITGRCPLSCMYCYAEDLMRNEDAEPDETDIARIARTILGLNPLVVVLTGGDPLSSPYLHEAVNLLRGRAGVIVDTNGYSLTERHIELFRHHRVTVRISIDSERPRDNELQRPLLTRNTQACEHRRGVTESAVDALCRCIQAGITVAVQSVATKKTANDLAAFGDKLYRLGVRSWRVMKVAPSRSRMAGYNKLIGAFTDEGKKIKGKQARGPYEFVFGKLAECQKGTWEERMSVQTISSDALNSVILVGPDGTFYTESNTSPGKTVIDRERPLNPTMHAIDSQVNMLAHVERYLNLVSRGNSRFEDRGGNG